MDRINLNTTNLTLEVTLVDSSEAALDLTNLISASICITKPDNTFSSINATVVDIPTGKVSIIIPAIDLAGVWKYQAEVILTGGNYPSTVGSFYVPNSILGCFL